MNTTSLKETIRRKQLLESGAVAPGRVTEIMPDGKGGHRVHRYAPSSWQRARAAAFTMEERTRLL